MKIHAWQSGVLKRQKTPYFMKYFCQRWQYICGGKTRAIFYARYLIEFTMCRGDLTFRIIFNASSLEILQFCNVKKWFWMILHTFIYTSVRIDFKAKSKFKCYRINFTIYKMSQISQLRKKKVIFLSWKFLGDWVRIKYFLGTWSPEREKFWIYKRSNMAAQWV